MTRLESAVQDAPDGLVHFKGDDPAWTTDVLFGSPRPYHVFVLITATNARYKCDVCQVLASDYQTLSQSYLQARASPEGRTSVSVVPADTRPVYFAVADYEHNAALFRKLDLSTVPHLVYFASNDDDAHDDNKKTFTLEPENVYSRFPTGNAHVKAQDLLERFIRPRSGLNFPIHEPLIHTILLIVQLVILATALVYLAVRHGAWLYGKLTGNKHIWMFISTWCYMLSISGMVFCVIRNPPLSAQGPKGEPVYISPDGRSQYILEGLLIGALNVLMAMSLLAVSQWTIYLPSSTLKTSVTTALVFAFYFTWSMIRSLYTFKNAWYAGF